MEDNNFQLSKIKEGWERSLSILRAEIGEATFKSWFKNIQFGDFSRSKLTLLVPTRFMRDWIENHYLDRILSSCKLLSSKTEYPSILRNNIVMLFVFFFENLKKNTN